MDLAEGNVSTVCERQSPKNEVESCLLRFQCDSFAKGTDLSRLAAVQCVTSEEYVERSNIRHNLNQDFCIGTAKITLTPTMYPTTCWNLNSPDF